MSAGAESFLAAPGGVLSGELTLPGDKSISHRALMLGAIADGQSEVSGFLAGEDCLATLRAMQRLGVRIEQRSATELTVHGVGRDGLEAPSTVLDMGNAGTAIRLAMGLLAGQRFASTLTGDESLRRRPMERVAEPLRRMGARVQTTSGCPPVLLQGGARLQAIDFALPVASAQLKSALLLAGLYAEGTTVLTEPGVTRDHSERMLRSFGVEVQCEPARVTLRGGQRLQGARLQVPADFSSAAFFLVAGALAAPAGLTLRQVGVNPTRTGLLELLQLMGADIALESRPGAGAEPLADIHVRQSRLRGIAVPAALVPLSIDEFPVFFIAAAVADGETVLRGAAELRVKESDRLAVMVDGLRTLGVECELYADGLRIQGSAGRLLQGGAIDSHGDHRIAMAFAVASTVAKEPIRIADVANVATSFPGFLPLAQRAGLKLSSG